MPAAVVGAVGAALLAAGLLAGCGSQATDPGSFVTPAATATPTGPVELTREQAADRYLDIVRPYNQALEELEQAFNGGQDLATLTRLAGATAAALETEIGQLQSTRWPAEVQSQVEDLVAASERALPHWREAAAVASRDDLVAAARAAGEHDGGEAAGTIRELLGLDPYDEDDY